MNKWTKRIITLLAVLSVVFIIVGYIIVQYGFFSAKQAALVDFKLKSPDFHYKPWVYVLYIHIITASMALAIGLYQMLRNPIGKQRTVWHKRVGKLYAYSILISGVVNMYLSAYASGGWIAKLGFFTLDFLWIYTTFKSVSYARKKLIEAHRNWMYRSYALTFAGITLRIVLGPLMMLFGEFTPAYQVTAWLSWGINLIIAEWFIYRSRVKPSLTTQQKVSIQ
ncbi:hypothetical protein Back11_49060 [Paenibacillus baekrokdamisoli]|uniref:Uncharacterized protein n=1 Tax=Paenibacillus baekrokdamisoli TaxID=1712516 RepID=A0A3G9JC99_9BACL|nr:DUF2306 domain-containing protein [Paenibacillus baekrokdamisoli]MBB3068730.1 putative membrane protein [Paenibacillus baekrokdamisoli]BBH23561.1 hypothetical protein Back11_49060 [Paenibacillus baekrokdamisoli]